MKSRVKVIVLSLALLLSTLVLTNVNMVRAYADGDKTIRFHYTRSDGAYDDWTMWVWNENENGKGYEFVVSADGSEAVSTYTCNAGTQKVGFIVKGKTDWSKDVSEDREIDLSAVNGDVVDVYLTSGVKEYTTALGDESAQTPEETTAASQEENTTVAPQESSESSSDSEQVTDAGSADDDEVESDDPNGDYSASTGTVIVADIVVLLVVAALCFTILGKKKDTMI